MKPHFYTFEKSRCYKTDQNWSLTLKMTTAQVVETSITVNKNNSPITRMIKLNLNDFWVRTFHSETGQVAISTKAPHGYIRVHGEYIWVTWSNIRTTSFPGCSTRPVPTERETERVGEDPENEVDVRKHKSNIRMHRSNILLLFL